MKGLWQGLADAVFPSCCPMCGTLLHDRRVLPFCDACLSEITIIRSPLCPACGMPFRTMEGSSHLCGECILSPRAFSSARSVGYYERVLLEAIHKFKYLGQTAIGHILGKLMADHEYPNFDIQAYSLIVPVPLHIKRLRERTFNQSLILARAIARKFSIPLDFTALKRHIHTQPQITLGRAERQANIRGAFQVHCPERIKGEKILLIDDVYTTGSTLNECARVLARSGAADIGVLTLARAV